MGQSASGHVTASGMIGINFKKTWNTNVQGPIYNYIYATYSPVRQCMLMQIFRRLPISKFHGALAANALN